MEILSLDVIFTGKLAIDVMQVSGSLALSLNKSQV